jgi:hypothetical protein
VGRNGSTELNLMVDPSPNSRWIPIIEQVSGIWNQHTAFKEAAIAASLQADLLAVGWFEPLIKEEAELLRDFTGQRISLEDLEPWTDKYTSLFAGQHVAVISPFAATIQEQYQKRNEVWPNGLLPTFAKLTTVRTGFSPSVAGRNKACAWPAGTRSWSDAVEYVVDQVPQDARIVLVGCGAVGMPAAAKLRQRGHIVVVLGGILQLLFGIKGRRWAKLPIAEAYNDAWTNPSRDETPSGFKNIEAGCYW